MTTNPHYTQYHYVCRDLSKKHRVYTLIQREYSP